MPCYLQPHVRFVAGPAGGALYDLQNATVHALAPHFAAIIKQASMSPDPNLESFSQDASAKAFLQVLAAAELTSTEFAPIQGLNAVQELNPKLIWLELTGRCNYTCQHCYADSDPQPRGTLPTARWLELIDQAASLGFPAIQFTGGDPLMHPDLLMLLQAARRRGFSLIEVYTNGSMLTANMLEQFANLNIHLALSFYSYRQDVYSKITNHQHGFERVIWTIRQAVAKNIPVRIGLIEMQENRDHLSQTIAFLRDLGVAESNIRIDGVRPSGRGVALQPSSCNSHSQLVPLEHLQDKPPIWRRPMPLPTTFRVHNQQAIWNSCWAGELVVTPEGDVFPCIFSRSEKLGNVAQVSLAQVLAGQALQAAWSTHLGHVEDCEICEFRFACFDCRALNVNVAGSRRAKPPSCIYNPRLSQFDWPRWLAQQNWQAWRELAPLRNGSFTVLEETQDHVVFYNAQSQQVAVLPYLSAAILDLADGARNLPQLLEVIRSTINLDNQEQLQQQVLLHLCELEARGLLTLMPATTLLSSQLAA